MIKTNYTYLFSYLFSFILIFYSCGFNCTDYKEKYIKELVINGVVVGKFKSQTGCFGNIIYRDNHLMDTLKTICYCVPENEKLWDYVIAGDSIIKKPGQTLFKVLRSGKEKKFEFPCCNR